MKKKSLIFCALGVFTLYFSSWAQNVPQGINYQAVIYNDPVAAPGLDIQNEIFANKSIGVLIEIDRGENQVYYAEIHQVKTNEFGMIDLVIGQGVANGPEEFEDILWEKGDYFLKVSIDKFGGDQFKPISRQKLWSVPYALYTSNALQSSSDIVEIRDNGNGTIRLIYRNGKVYDSPKLTGLSGSPGKDGEDGNTVLHGIGSPGNQIGKDGDFYIDTKNSVLFGPKLNTWPSGIVLKGSDGINGINGANGNSVLNGNGVPATGIGMAGDFYFDKTNRIFYGPKSSSWGIGFSIVGPAGKDGTDGKTIFSGAGGPSTTVGSVGDFYFDTQNKIFYGPRTTTSWGNGFSIVGPAGTNGLNGSNGTNGQDGKTILSGNGVPSNGLGANGDFYYDLLNRTFYGPKGTTWGNGFSIIGPVGASGQNGTNGQNGVNGTNGQDGKTIHSGNGAPTASIGASGDFYYDLLNRNFYGPKGATWGSGISIVGPAGTNGQNGVNGTNGQDGKTIHSGNGVPSNGLGASGDFYYDVLNRTFYGPKGATWGSGFSIVGPAGTNGQNGVNGTNGQDGKTIYSGNGVPSISIGVIGDFYYDLVNRMFYGPKGATWGAGFSIIGPAGVNGQNGTNGINGTNGVDGKTIYNGNGTPPASVGVTGDYYYDITNRMFYGPKGATWGTGVSIIGPAGANGQDGMNGLNGLDGANGKTIHSSAGPPTQGIGVQGDFYYDSLNKKFHGPKGATWDAGFSMIGPAGPPGNNGFTGTMPGQILYYNGTTWQTLDPGQYGQQLYMDSIVSSGVKKLTWKGPPATKTLSAIFNSTGSILTVTGTSNGDCSNRGFIWSTTTPRPTLYNYEGIYWDNTLCQGQYSTAIQTASYPSGTIVYIRAVSVNEFGVNYGGINQPPKP